MTIIKSDLLIGKKILGKLLYFNDARGRGCLKLSFKNKIAGFSKGTDMPTRLPVPMKMIDPIGLEISYKFQDRLLEVKKNINGNPAREFYNAALPATSSLFIIRIKDWHSLDDARASNSPLVLVPPNGQSGVAVVFSFLGSNGRPISPREYHCHMWVIDLPENDVKTFCIGIAKDPSPEEQEGFHLMIPAPIPHRFGA